MILLAKSIRNGGTTLADHTRHVVQAIDAVALHLLDDPARRVVARHGAILHDLGKGHPYFQRSLEPDFDRRTEVEPVPHRHELSSLLFLPLFLQPEWPALVDMVVAHHKSLFTDDKKGRGLVDLVETYGDEIIFQRHAGDWERWHLALFPILEEYSIACREITLTEARAAFDSVLEHCERHRIGWNRWRGLLMTADHFASAIQEETSEKVPQLFLKPHLSAFRERAASADATLYPLAKYSVDDPRPHTLVIAPTGAGKTDFLMRRCHHGRIFYLLPFQASINAMFLRFQNMLGTEVDLRRVHAASAVELEGAEFEEHLLQRHPGAAIKVMTPHQLAALILGTSGHEAMALDVAGQEVILDEVHVYNEVSQAMVLAMVTTLTRLGAHVHIGSATTPAALETELRLRLGGEGFVHTVRLSEPELNTYDRHRVYRLPDEAAAQSTIREALDAKQRVLFLSNRVATAQARFQWALDAFPNLPILLVHGRFRRCDRAQLEAQITRFEQQAGPCLVCATQVIEVSLDISFDTLVTDTAPLDSMIQRFGRVNRRRTHEPKLCPVYVIAPPGDSKAALPYDIEVLRRSWGQLPEGDVLAETTLQERIDAVYPQIDVRAIDTHLKVNTEGDLILPQLCHLRRSLLVEMLEIDSAACIRHSDEEAYRRGRLETRVGLEIPVTWRAIRPFARQWTQLTGIGNYPFIVPDSLYDARLGLTLKEIPPESRMI